MKVDVLSLGLVALAMALLIPTAQASPGISVTLVDLEPLVVEPTDNATFLVAVQSLASEDENVRVTISWDPNIITNWTKQEFVLGAGQTSSLALQARRL